MSFVWRAIRCQQHLVMRVALLAVDHVAILCCQRLTVDGSRSVCKHRVAKQSTLVVASLEPRHHDDCLYTAVAGIFSTMVWYPRVRVLCDRHHKNVQFWNRSTGTYAPKLTVLLNVHLRQGLHLLVDEYLIHLWQSRVEIKHYSVAYFNHVTVFEAL